MHQDTRRRPGGTSGHSFRRSGVTPGCPSILRTRPSGWPRAWARSTSSGRRRTRRAPDFRAQVGESHRQRVDLREFLDERDADVLRVEPLHERTSASSRPRLACSGCAELDGAALLDVIARIQRELGHDVALDDRLAAQPRRRRQVPRRVEPVGLVVFHLAEVLHALPDDEVTRRAGAAAAAGVLERDAGSSSRRRGTTRADRARDTAACRARTPRSSACRPRRMKVTLGITRP